MRIQAFEVPGLAQYSYVVSSGKDAIVIDPMRDFDRYTQYASQLGLRIKYVVETHIHADFASGAPGLAEATGAELALSAYDAGEQYIYAMEHLPLRDGDSLKVGTVRIEAVHTPGHTPEHLSFVVFDENRSATEPVAIFTGDFLFAGSLGRPDLLGDGEKLRLAKELYRSLHNRIADLPDSLQVFPGHGAGSLCGAGMSERSESTLGYERKTQRWFRLGEEEFLSEILSTLPPMPAYYPRMKRLNSAGAPPIKVLPGGEPICGDQFATLSSDPSVIVLDVRRAEAFGGAHIEGAINIGAGPNLSLWAGWMFDPSKSIALVGEGDDEQETRRSLVRVGLDNVAGFLSQGIPAWIDAGRTIGTTPQVSTKQVHKRSADTHILDVRTDEEWNSGHIEGAEHIALGELAHHLHILPRSRPTVAVCGSGYRSNIAASLLQSFGYRDVSSMAGGMAAWHSMNLPLVK